MTLMNVGAFVIWALWSYICCYSFIESRKSKFVELYELILFAIGYLIGLGAIAAL